MEKMDGKTKDIVAENVARLQELFPEAFTEDGTTDRAQKKKIDFAVLKELLGEYVSDKDERYSFTWNGKSNARRLAQTPSTATLRPCREESVDWDSTRNIFIEGDNLEVLKLLQKSYHKKVKMIYIDPPYNTGKDFIYKDKFKDSIKNYKEITGQVDGNGRNHSNNPETSGRYHTDWLNMMYPRLKLARNLLKDDGVIFISIGDEELFNLKQLCNEIFGEEEYRNCFAVRRHDKNLNRQFMESGLKSLNVGLEHILVYAKSNEFNFFSVFKEASSERANNGYWKGFWNAPDRPTMRYDILGFKPEEGQWKWKEETARIAIDNYKIFQKNFASKMTLEEYWEKTGKSKKFIRRNLSGSGKNMGVENWIEPSSGILRNSNMLDVLATQSNDEVRCLFDFPKNIEILKILNQLSTSDNDIILDFFAGSATTAHAVMQLNAEDNGNRTFIMVQLPEATGEQSEACKAGYKNIAEISKERIRRAGAQLKMDNGQLKMDNGQWTVENGQLTTKDGKNYQFSTVNSQLDIGFKVFKLDSTNIKPWQVDCDLTERTLEAYISNIKDDRSPEDILYEILLKYGLDLTLPVTEHIIAGQQVCIVGAGALIICLSDAITVEVVEGIASLKDTLTPDSMRVVFKDAGFTDDVLKTNTMQMLKQAGIIDVKSI